MRVWRVKTSFRRPECGFSCGRRAGAASIACVFDPIEAAEGRSVIFSSRACRTASGRAFFMMWVAVDKWIMCGLRMGLDKRNEDSLRVRLLHV